MKFDFIPDNVSKFDNVYDVLKERGFIEQSTDCLLYTSRCV